MSMTTANEATGTEGGQASNDIPISVPTANINVGDVIPGVSVDGEEPPACTMGGPGRPFRDLRYFPPPGSEGQRVI